MFLWTFEEEKDCFFFFFFFFDMHNANQQVHNSLKHKIGKNEHILQIFSSKCTFFRFRPFFFSEIKTPILVADWGFTQPNRLLTGPFFLFFLRLALLA